MNNNNILVIGASKETIQDILPKLKEFDSEAEMVQTKNVGGGAESWLAVLSISIHSLSILVDFFKVKGTKLNTIQLGDNRAISNRTDDDLKRITVENTD